MRRLLIVGCCAALLALAVDALAAAPAAPVLLGGGNIGTYRWQASISRGQGKQGGRRPCLEVSVIPPPSTDPLAIGPSTSRACRTLSPQHPNLLSVSDDTVTPSRSAFGALFDRRARHLRVDLGKRGTREIRLFRLTKRKAKRAGVEHLRYATLAFAGDFCLRRFRVYDKRGLLIDDSGRMSCR